MVWWRYCVAVLVVHLFWENWQALVFVLTRSFMAPAAPIANANLKLLCVFHRLEQSEQAPLPRRCSIVLIGVLLTRENTKFLVIEAGLHSIVKCPFLWELPFFEVYLIINGTLLDNKIKELGSWALWLWQGVEFQCKERVSANIFKSLRLVYFSRTVIQNIASKPFDFGWLVEEWRANKGLLAGKSTCGAAIKEGIDV